MTDSLLIIEDEPLLGMELARHYERQGWDTTLVDSLAGAREALASGKIEPLVVLSDMSLPDGNALDLLEEVRASGRGGEWVLLTGFGSVPDAARAGKLGAYDFLEKPCDQDRLDVVVRGAARSGRAQRRLDEQASSESRRFPPECFLGASKAAGEVREMLEKLVTVPFSALIITGETGTGKGLAARILHHSGPRRREPLVEVNCAALPRDLLESELFGHEAGSFTGAKGRRRGLFEQAEGGTLFLDEISEMDLELQAKLLKAIEDKSVRRIGAEKAVEIDVQIVAASNRDLPRRIRDGAFRDDLYHRLSAFELRIPALRERTEDLAELVPAFVAEFNAVAGKRVSEIPDPVWDRMRGHDWPGNIRELRNVVERGVLFSDGAQFPERWLQLGSAGTAGDARPEVDGDRISLPLDGSIDLDDMDRLIIQAALERAGHNVTAAARNLGTTREKLRYRIRKYGLDAKGKSR